jgi:hypothetical protein
MALHEVRRLPIAAADQKEWRKTHAVITNNRNAVSRHIRQLASLYFSIVIKQAAGTWFTVRKKFPVQRELLAE